MYSIENIKQQLERLFRHYQVAVKSNDRIAFLDLSNCLRIWTELKNEIDTINYPLFNSSLFYIGSPSNNLSKLVKGEDYIWACFPNKGVFTYAHKGNIFATKFSKNKSFSSDFSVKVDEINRLWIGSFCICKGLIDQKVQLEHSLLHFKENKVTYSSWMNSDAIRIYKTDNGGLNIISIEVFIKRVANALEGSHASKINDKDKFNKFDPLIIELLDYTLCDVLLPHFILLKLAQELLKIFPIIINIGGYNL